MPRAALAAAVLSGLLVGFACTHEQQTAVRTVLAAGEAGCVLVPGLPERAEEVCLALPEVREAVDAYLRARAARARASASASTTPSPASPAPKGSP